MSFVYYNDVDEGAAEWLRELINRGLIPAGVVDSRSILEIQPEEIREFTSWHFFAGIGGWPLALRMMDMPDDWPVMTGSAPCQPFSVAGLQLGKDDERHLAPTWLKIIKELRPARVFGEQVEAAIGKEWLDDLFHELEDQNYTCGAAVLPACSIGAPHIRKRLCFGAVRLADTGRESGEWNTRSIHSPQKGEHRTGQLDGTLPERYKHSGPVDRVAQPTCEQHDGARARRAAGRTEHPDGGATIWMANANNARPQGWTGMSERSDEQPIGPGGLESRSTNSHHGGWADADWLGCRDGKFRPVEPGTQPLAHGIPKGLGRSSVTSLEEYPGAARVMRLRGYGNAVVPSLMAEFMTAFNESVEMAELTGDL